MYNINVATEDLQQVRSLLGEIVQRFDSVEDNLFLREVTVLAQELPRSLRRSLNTFRLEEPSGVCLISGYPVDDKQIGPTPPSWKAKGSRSLALEEEVFFFLCLSLVGDPIAWSTQQDGYVLHDILPIKGHEREQMGSGSEQELTWHVEDAFHPYRGDYLALMCMRNPDRIPTSYASIETIRLQEETASLLFEPRFTIRPDEGHSEKSRTTAPGRLEGSRDLLDRAIVMIERMHSDPDEVSVLFGDPKDPYVRIDPYYMRSLDDEHSRALSALIGEFNAGMTKVELAPGEIVIMDNYKVVHGRPPFKARYDGTDRWLKRLNVARDLRKSREVRMGPASRVIF